MYTLRVVKPLKTPHLFGTIAMNQETMKPQKSLNGICLYHM